VPRFVRRVRAATHDYLDEATRLKPIEIQAQLTGLSARIDRAFADGLSESALAMVIDALTALSEEACAALEIGSPASRFATPEDVIARVRGDVVTDPESILDFTTPAEVLQHLQGLCWRGAKVIPGRKRRDGTRSAARLRWLPVQPSAAPGRPADTAERQFCMVLDEIYFEATAGRGSYWNPECPSPFEQLVETVLRACRPHVVGVRDLVRRHARWRAAHTPERVTPQLSRAIC
jgi:hypothetical protein